MENEVVKTAERTAVEENAETGGQAVPDKGTGLKESAQSTSLAEPAKSTGLAASIAALFRKEEGRYRKLRRRELVELVKSQSARLEVLEAQNREMMEQLENREIIITESGSLAEACMRMNGIFEAAQKSCDQYLENAKKNTDRLKEETEKECESLRESVMQECVSLREKTWQDCVDLREKTRQDCADLRERLLEAFEKQMRGITLMPDISELPAMEEISFPKADAIEEKEEKQSEDANG